MSSPFRALRSRNYRLFFIGQGISLIGSWMTRLATAWLVYRLTDSAFLLGLVSFAGQAPSLFLPPLAGVWLDRWDRHKVLVVTQVLAMVQSLAMAALTLSGYINIPWIIGLTLFQGVVNAVEIPDAPGVRGPDDRRPRRPQQRHRAQLVELQRRAAGRARPLPVRWWPRWARATAS